MTSPAQPLPLEVRRYDTCLDYSMDGDFPACSMVESRDGGWVSAVDYEALLDRLNALSNKAEYAENDAGAFADENERLKQALAASEKRAGEWQVKHHHLERGIYEALDRHSGAYIHWTGALKRALAEAKAVTETDCPAPSPSEAKQEGTQE